MCKSLCFWRAKVDSIFCGFISIVASTLLRSGRSVSIFRDDTPWLYGAHSTLFHGPELSLRLTSFLSKAGSKHSKFGVLGCIPSLVCKLAVLPRSFSIVHSPKLTFWGDWQFLLPFLPFRFVHAFFCIFRASLVFIVKVIEMLSIGSRLHPDECTPCFCPVQRLLWARWKTAEGLQRASEIDYQIDPKVAKECKFTQVGCFKIENCTVRHSRGIVNGRPLHSQSWMLTQYQKAWHRHVCVLIHTVNSAR